MIKRSSVIEFLARLGRDRRGDAIVGFALLVPVLLMVTAGIIEFSIYMFERGRATEATRRGTRAAVVQIPIASLDDLANGSVTCTSASGAASCGGVAIESQASLDAIVADMQRIMPTIAPENVRVVYSFSGLGQAESGGIKPFVTVSLINLQHQYVMFGIVPGMSGTQTFPSFATTEIKGGYQAP